jgi:hypothetical protein
VSPDDALIGRLRERVGDPAARVDDVPSRFGLQLQGMSLGELMVGGQELGADLTRLVEMLRSGAPVDEDLHRRAESIGEQMSTPEPAPLPAVATVAEVDELERALGLALPEFVRRLYLEVADGGFGPRAGLLPLRAVGEAYAELTSESPSEVEDEEWPRSLVPLVATDAGHECVDVETMRIVESDFDEIEHEGEVVFGLVLRDRAESAQRWLAAWLEQTGADPPPA